MLFIVYSSPLKQYSDKVPEVCERIKQTGIFATVVFMFRVCILVCASSTADSLVRAAEYGYCPFPFRNGRIVGNPCHIRDWAGGAG